MNSQSTIDTIKKYQRWIETEIFSSPPEAPQSIPREIILTQKGKQYSQRKENLRKELESVSIPSFQPLILNKHAKTPQDSSRSSVEDRLLTAGRKYQITRDEKKKQKHTDEIPPKRPSSAVQTDVHERLMRIKKIYNDRNDMMALAHAQKQQNVLQEPKLCKNSREIIGRRTGKVEDRLIQQGHQTEQVRKAKEAVAEFECGLISKPIITKRASSLVRNELIEDRLLRYTHRYNENLKNLSYKYDSNYTFKPEISKLARSRSPSPIISTLRSRTPSPTPSHKRAKSPSINSSTTSRRDISPSSSTFKLTQRSTTPNADYNFQPEINSHSKQLARHMESSSERLLRPFRKENIPPDEEICPFKPLINSNSKQLDNRKKYDDSGNRKNRWDALYELHELHKLRKRELKKQYEVQSEDKNCTFQPYLGRDQYYNV